MIERFDVRVLKIIFNYIPSVWIPHSSSYRHTNSTNTSSTHDQDQGCNLQKYSYRLYN